MKVNNYGLFPENIPISIEQLPNESSIDAAKRIIEQTGVYHSDFVLELEVLYFLEVHRTELLNRCADSNNHGWLVESLAYCNFTLSKLYADRPFTPVIDNTQSYISFVYSGRFINHITPARYVLHKAKETIAHLAKLVVEIQPEVNLTFNIAEVLLPVMCQMSGAANSDVIILLPLFLCFCQYAVDASSRHAANKALQTSKTKEDALKRTVQANITYMKALSPETDEDKRAIASCIKTNEDFLSLFDKVDETDII